MTRAVRRLGIALALGVCTVTVVAAASAIGRGSTAAAATPPPTFTNFSLAATPPNPAGTVCPGSSLCYNGAAEPAIRATPDGQFFGSSENGLGSGTLAWRSSDNGLHYSSLLSPNNLSAGSADTGKEAGVEPGGGDTDVAVATAKNSAGNYNVYVSSLTLASVDVSTSTDNGASWTLNPAAALLPIDDRPWIAAKGSSNVCISYLTAPGILLPEFGYHVQCSSDAGATFPQVADAYDSSPAGQGCSLGSRTGNLAFAPNDGNTLYAIAACGTVADATNPNPTGLHVVVVAVSNDGGKTFTDHVAYANPDVTADYQNNFPNIAVDRAGNVYAVYSDDKAVFYSYSTDHGQSWHGPFQVSNSGQTAIYPWASAGDAGKIDVVYYKTPFLATPANPNPSNFPSSAAWTVGFAQNLNATTPGSSFTESTPTPIVHYGAVCQGGAGCTGNRDLYDDFGVAASPTTGLASIIYSDDQYVSGDPNSVNSPSCTSAQNNSGACDHTAIATQTGGSPIFTHGGGGCHEGDGEGHIHGKKSGEASFQIDQDGCEDGDAEHVNASDPGSNMDFHSTQINSVRFDDVAHTVTIVGQGLDNGVPVTFTAVGLDNGATALDTFSLTLSDGYANAGNLLDGTITLN